MKVHMCLDWDLCVSAWVSDSVETNDYLCGTCWIYMNVFSKRS